MGPSKRSVGPTPASDRAASTVVFSPGSGATRRTPAARVAPARGWACSPGGGRSRRARPRPTGRSVRPACSRSGGVCCRARSHAASFFSRPVQGRDRPAHRCRADLTPGRLTPPGAVGFQRRIRLLGQPRRQRCQQRVTLEGRRPRNRFRRQVARLPPLLQPALHRRQRHRERLHGLRSLHPTLDRCHDTFPHILRVRLHPYSLTKGSRVAQAAVGPPRAYKDENARLSCSNQYGRENASSWGVSVGRSSGCAALSQQAGSSVRQRDVTEGPAARLFGRALHSRRTTWSNGGMQHEETFVTVRERSDCQEPCGRGC